jgi:D-arabinose 1-dehydrogenase-like Zn-dependent alcohol dehydrogenase
MTVLLRVKACGMCDSDAEQYDGAFGQLGLRYPVIPGHEPVGYIEEVGAEAAGHWASSAAIAWRLSRCWDADIAERV